MAFTIPTGWTKYDLTSDRVTYRRPGHSNEIPNLVIFSRRPQSGDTSEYQVKWVKGNADEASDKNTIITLHVRNVAGQVASDIASFLDDLGAICIDDGFQDDCSVDGGLPI